jgi:hypothetical protein
MDTLLGVTTLNGSLLRDFELNRNNSGREGDGGPVVDVVVVSEGGDVMDAPRPVTMEVVVELVDHGKK